MTGVRCPPQVMKLYATHKRARQAMGRQPLSLMMWANDRVDVPGYEAVTRWMTARARVGRR